MPIEFDSSIVHRSFDRITAANFIAGSIGVEELTDPKPQDGLLHAAFEQENFALAGLRWATQRQHFEPELGYVAKLENLVGYEDNLDSFAPSVSPAQTEDIKRKIDRERKNREIIQEAGWKGFAAMMFAGIVSPENFIPFALLVRGGRMALSLTRAGRQAFRGAETMRFIPKTRIGRVGAQVGTGVATAGLAEVGLQSLQETRTYEETAANVIGSAVFAGILGGAAQSFGKLREGAFNRLQGEERAAWEAMIGRVLDPLEDDVDDAFAKALPDRESIGAMKVEEHEAATIMALNAPGKESARLALGPVGKIVGAMVRTPWGRMARHQIDRVRQLSATLLSTPVLRKGQLAGTERLGQAVETKVDFWRDSAKRIRLEVKHDFLDYRKRGGNDFNKLEDWNENVSWALINGDKHSTPEVAKAAKTVRAFFDGIKQQAIDVGLLSKTDFDLDGTALSYLFRRYDKEFISTNEGREVFKTLLIDSFANDKALAARLVPELRGETNEALAEKVIDNIMGDVHGHLAVVSDASPLRARKIPIPDNVLRDNGLLIKDINVIIHDFVHAMAPRIELARINVARSQQIRGLVSTGSRIRKAIDRSAPDAEADLKLATLRVQDLNAVRVLKYAKPKLGERLESLMDLRETILRTLSGETRRRRFAGLEGQEQARVLQAREPQLASGLKPITDEIDSLRLIASKLEEGPRTVELKDPKLPDEFRNTDDIDIAMDNLDREIAELRRREANDGFSMRAIKKLVDKDFQELKKGKSAGESKKIEANRENIQQDIETVRQRIAQIVNGPDDANHFGFRAASIMKTLNYLRVGGGFMISSMSDLANHILVNGMGPNMRALGAVLRDPSILKSGELQRMAVAAELVGGSRRLQSFIGFEQDLLGRTRTERFLDSTREAFSKITLLAHWNAYHRSFASLAASDRVLTDALRVTRGQTISRARRNNLILGGYDDESLRRIADMFEEFGKEDGGLLIARSEDWTDLRAKDAFEKGILQDMDRTIVRPGAGETPRFMSKPFLSLIGQFKTFAFANTQRVLLSSLSRRDSQVVSAMFAAVFWGGITEITKNSLAGRETKLDSEGDFSRFVANAIDRSGVTGIFFDINNMAERVSQGLVGIQPVLGGEGTSRFSSRGAMDALAGPTYGLVEDILRGAGIVKSGMTEGDLRAMRRLIPFQNLFYIRWMVDQVETGFQDALNIPRQRPR